MLSVAEQHLHEQTPGARLVMYGQELDGHQDLSTTQRYMHLSSAAIDAAIRLLDSGREETRTAVACQP